MKKKILALILAVLMVIGTLPVTALATSSDLATTEISEETAGEPSEEVPEAEALEEEPSKASEEKSDSRFGKLLKKLSGSEQKTLGSGVPNENIASFSDLLTKMNNNVYSSNQSGATYKVYGNMLQYESGGTFSSTVNYGPVEGNDVVTYLKCEADISYHQITLEKKKYKPSPRTSVSANLDPFGPVSQSKTFIFGVNSEGAVMSINDGTDTYYPPRIAEGVTFNKLLEMMGDTEFYYYSHYESTYAKLFKEGSALKQKIANNDPEELKQSESNVNVYLGTTREGVDYYYLEIAGEYEDVKIDFYVENNKVVKIDYKSGWENATYEPRQVATDTDLETLLNLMNGVPFADSSNYYALFVGEIDESNNLIYRRGEQPHPLTAANDDKVFTAEGPEGYTRYEIDFYYTIREYIYEESYPTRFCRVYFDIAEDNTLKEIICESADGMYTLMPKQVADGVVLGNLLTNMNGKTFKDNNNHCLSVNDQNQLKLGENYTLTAFNSGKVFVGDGPEGYTWYEVDFSYFDSNVVVDQYFAQNNCREIYFGVESDGTVGRMRMKGDYSEYTLLPPLKTVTLTVDELHHGGVLPQYAYFEELDTDCTAQWYTEEGWEASAPIQGSPVLKSWETYYLSVGVTAPAGFDDAPTVKVNENTLVSVGSSEKFYVLNDDGSMRAVCKMTVGLPVGHDLKVMKDGKKAIQGVDYQWNGDELDIWADGLTVTGETTKEYISVEEDVTTLTLDGVKITNESEANIIHADGDLKLTLNGVTIEKYGKDGAISAVGDLELILAEGSENQINQYFDDYVHENAGEIVYVVSGDNLTVRGGGDLVVKGGNQYCLYTAGALRFAYGVGDVELRCSYSNGVIRVDSGVFPFAGNYTVKGSTSSTATEEELLDVVFKQDGKVEVKIDAGGDKRAHTLIITREDYVPGEHDLKISKSGGEPVYGTDYFWKDGNNGCSVLCILSDGMTVTGTTTDEAIYTCCNDLTLDRVSISLPETVEESALYAMYSLRLTLSDGTTNTLSTEKSDCTCIYGNGDLIFIGTGDLNASSKVSDTVYSRGVTIFADGLGTVVLSCITNEMEKGFPVCGSDGIAVSGSCTVLGSSQRDGSSVTQITEENYVPCLKADRVVSYQVFQKGDNDASAVKITGNGTYDPQISHTLRLKKADDAQMVFGVDYCWTMNGENENLIIFCDDLVLSGGTADNPALNEQITVYDSVTKLTLAGVNVKMTAGCFRNKPVLDANGDLEICLQAGTTNSFIAKKAEESGDVYEQVIYGNGDLIFSGGGKLEVDNEYSGKSAIELYSDADGYSGYVGGRLIIRDGFGELIARGGGEDPDSILWDSENSGLHVWWTHFELPAGYGLFGNTDRNAVDITSTAAFRVFTTEAYVEAGDNIAYAMKIAKNDEPGPVEEEHDLTISSDTDIKPVKDVDYKWVDDVLYIYRDGLTVTGESKVEGLCIYANEVTLDGVKIESDRTNLLLAQRSKTLTLNLLGENVLKKTSGGKNGSVIYVPWDLTIQGNGRLTVNAENDACIETGHDLTITDTAVVTAENNGRDITVWAENNILLGTMPALQLLRGTIGGIKLAATNKGGSALGCEGVLTIGKNVDSVLLRGNDTAYNCGALRLRNPMMAPEGFQIVIYGSADENVNADGLKTPAEIRRLTVKPTEHIGDIHENEYNLYPAFVDDDVAKIVILSIEEKPEEQPDDDDDDDDDSECSISRIFKQLFGWMVKETSHLNIPCIVKTTTLVTLAVLFAHNVHEAVEEITPAVREGITLLETALVINAARVLLYGFGE